MSSLFSNLFDSWISKKINKQKIFFITQDREFLIYINEKYKGHMTVI